MAHPPRMLTYLAQTCRARRRDSHVSIIRIALSAYVDVSTIRRFERASALSYPDHLDEIVAAYARVLKTTPAKLWMLAAQEWVISDAVAGRRG